MMSAKFPWTGIPKKDRSTSKLAVIICEFPSYFLFFDDEFYL